MVSSALTPMDTEEHSSEMSPSLVIVAMTAWKEQYRHKTRGAS